MIFQLPTRFTAMRNNGASYYIQTYSSNQNQLLKYNIVFYLHLYNPLFIRQHMLILIFHIIKTDICSLIYPLPVTKETVCASK